MRSATGGGGWAGRGYVVAVAVAVAGAAALAACGGGGSSTTKTTSTTTASAAGSAATNQATAAYRQCLKQHGVTFGGRNRGAGGQGDGQPPGTGTPPSSRAPLSAAARAKRQAAQQACQSKLPQGFTQQRQQDLAAYRSCMKDHGVTLPATTGNGFGGPQGVNRNDPKFQAANKVCGALLPNGGRFGGGANGSGGSTATSGASGALGTPSRSAV